MAEALTGPFLVASLLLCVAGVAKLRSPKPAARALADASLPASTSTIRTFAAGETALGAYAALAPGPAIAAAIAVVYAGFAGLALLLARRASSCGCLGATDTPATPLHAAVSAALALIAAAAASWPVHGAAWIFGRSPGVLLGLVIGIGGAVFGTVVVYSVLPQAWASWGGR
jgi:hypothetical protein